MGEVTEYQGNEWGDSGKVPREKQLEAIQALWQYFNAGNRGNPLLVEPTGSGKSLIIAWFIRQASLAYPGQRILMLTHDKRLIEQNAKELADEFKDASIGLFCASLNRKEAHMNIVFASIQSVARNLRAFRPFDLIMIDEAHMVPAKAHTQYRKVLDYFGSLLPYVPVIGLTATPYRLGSGNLHTGEDALFTEIIHETPVSYLIENNDLCNVITKGGTHKLAVDDLNKRGGEFIDKQVANALRSDETFLEDAIDEVMRYGADRKSWLIFCVDIEHCEEVTSALAARGVHCPAIHSKNSKAYNDEQLALFKEGLVRGVTNRDMLTVGFNNPMIDFIVMFRPTESIGLYVQMIGRGMRTAYGKLDCLVLDYAKNVERHGPVDMINVTDPSGGGGGPAPAKECPNCHWVGPTGTRFCPECNHEFEFKGAQLDAEATEAAILSNQLQPKRMVPTNVLYANNHKSRWDPTKKDTMKVTYICGFSTHNEWVCIEHDRYGLAGRKAVEWLTHRQLPADVITTVDQAVEVCQQHLPVPAEIVVTPDGQFERIAAIMPPYPPIHATEVEPPPMPWYDAKPQGTGSSGELQESFLDFDDDELPF